MREKLFSNDFGHDHSGPLREDTELTMDLVSAFAGDRPLTNHETAFLAGWLAERLKKREDAGI